MRETLETRRSTRIARHAAIIDRYAHMTILRINRAGKGPEFRPRILISTRPQIVRDLHGTWGGSIRAGTLPSGNPRASPQWEISGLSLTEMLRAIVPHLHRQRSIAQAMLDTREIIESLPHVGVGKPRPQEALAQMQRLYEYVQELNEPQRS